MDQSQGPLQRFPQRIHLRLIQLFGEILLRQSMTADVVPQLVLRLLLLLHQMVPPHYKRAERHSIDIADRLVIALQIHHVLDGQHHQLAVPLALMP